MKWKEALHNFNARHTLVQLGFLTGLCLVIFGAAWTLWMAWQAVFIMFAGACICLAIWLDDGEGP